MPSTNPNDGTPPGNSPSGEAAAAVQRHRQQRDSARTSKLFAAAGESARDALVEQPTITVRPGARVRVLVSRDLVLEPWLDADR